MPDASQEGTSLGAYQPSDPDSRQEPKGAMQPMEADALHEAPSKEAPQADSADSGQPSPGAAASPASPSEGERKWAKPLLVAVACVLVAAIAVGAYFVWQAGEKSSIASAAVEQLKGSDAISGLVIPSEWGDQSGFSVGGVDVDSVDGGMLPGGSARVAVKADIGNGRYDGQGCYDIAMRKEGSSWVADGIQQTDLTYYPVSGISDEVLLARIPELVGEAYALANAEGVAFPDPTALFGDGTTGEVLANSFEFPADEVEMMLVAQRDGATYQEKLTLGFDWYDAGGEPADWHLSVAGLDEGAYLAVGSFLREGVDLPDDYEPLAQDEWVAGISPDLDFRDGSPYAWAFLENPPDSTVSIEVTIELDDGQVIYASPRIPPNHALEAIRADQLPAKGVYDAKARFRAYDGGALVGENTLDTRVIVS